MPSNPGMTKSFGNADDHQRAGADAQDQKSGEDHDVHHAGLFVARLAVLAQPDLETL
jgi:hypothetical protein